MEVWTPADAWKAEDQYDVEEKYIAMIAKGITWQRKMYYFISSRTIQVLTPATK